MKLTLPMAAQRVLLVLFALGATQQYRPVGNIIVEPSIWFKLIFP
jgi:hypothetical protein